MMAATNRTGSASATSQLSHANGRCGAVAAQSASSAVLPAPGEPTTRVRRARCPQSSTSSSLDRGTRWDAAVGTENFDDGNRGPRGPSATLPVLSVIFSRPLAAPLGLVSPLSTVVTPVRECVLETISPTEGDDKTPVSKHRDCGTSGVGSQMDDIGDDPEDIRDHLRRRGGPRHRQCLRGLRCERRRWHYYAARPTP